MRRKPFLLVAFVGGSRLDPAGSFVPTNTKQALSNMLQRRSGAMMQPPSLHAITSQQQLIQMKLLQQQQQQRLLRQAQTRPFQQVCPDQQCLPHFISSSSQEWVWACDWFFLCGHPWLPVRVHVYLSCTGLYILLPSLYFTIIIDQKRTWNVLSWLKVCLKAKRRANDFLITYKRQDFYLWDDLIWALTPVIIIILCAPLSYALMIHSLFAVLLWSCISEALMFLRLSPTVLCIALTLALYFWLYTSPISIEGKE